MNKTSSKDKIFRNIFYSKRSSHNCTSEGGWACSFGGTAMCNRGNTLPGSFGDQYSSHTIDIAIRYQNEPFGGSNYYDYQLGYSQEPTTNLIPEIFNFKSK